MAKKALNEAQLREYVEQEVRKALVNENMGSPLLNECINEVIKENMTNEWALDWLVNLFNGNKQTGDNGGGVSLEGIVGAILSRFFAPVLKKFLEKIGIMPDSKVGKFLLDLAVTYGGYAIGQLIDKKWDPIGFDNIFRGSQPQGQQQAQTSSE